LARSDTKGREVQSRRLKSKRTAVTTKTPGVLAAVWTLRAPTGTVGPEWPCTQPRRVGPLYGPAFCQANGLILRAAVESALLGEVRLETTDETMVWRSVEIWG
jgi:hypothetical protein